MKATRLIHDLAGRPNVEGGVAKLLTDRPSVCCVCGREEQMTAPADRALGANFTDRRMFTRPDSDRACAACVAVCSGKPPRTWRMWSVVATPGHELPPSQEKASAWIGQHDSLCLTSRADTHPIIDTLLDPPDTEWVVSIAMSGQKHVLPYAQINSGTVGVIRMEATDVAYRTGDWRQVFSAALGLRRLGVPADDILHGTPRYLHTRDHLAQLTTLNRQLTGWHNTPLLSVALWTITKGITNDADRYPQH